MFNTRSIIPFILYRRKTSTTYLIEDYISLDTIKTMFPAYNDFNFFDDWGIKVYLYKDNLIIYKSGYNYVFKKKNLNNK